MKVTIPMLLLLLALFVPACSSGGSPVSEQINTSPPTVVSPAAVMPTGVVLPAEETLSPDWQGIPIPPDALAGEGDEEGYVFTARVAVEQIRSFYEVELSRLGWESMPTDDASTMMFVRNDETLTISLLTKGDEVLVILSR